MELTPTDELTGLPLPVLVKGADFYITRQIKRKQDYHHHFHPENSTDLGYSEAGVKLPAGDPLRIEGLALRYSRGQQLPNWLHRRYHGIYQGPELPSDTKTKFTQVVLACAGVVPREAIDLYTPGEAKTVSLSNKQHDFIRRGIHFEGAGLNWKRSRRGRIGRFLADYAITTPLSDILTEEEIRKKVDEFLLPKSSSQRADAGSFILKHAIGASVEEVLDIHQEALKEGMVGGKVRELGQVVLNFFTEDRFPQYFAPLEDRLTNAGL